MPKRVRRKRDPLAPKPHPRFGATKAQAERFQATRNLQNRIHELEVGLRDAQESLTESINNTREAVRQREALRPDPKFMAALSKMMTVSLGDAVRAGIVEPLLEISRWLIVAESKRKP